MYKGGDITIKGETRIKTGRCGETWADVAKKRMWLKKVEVEAKKGNRRLK